MKVAVVGINTGFIKKNLSRYGFNIAKKPDLVFSVGGDGTCLLSEQKYPNVPKLFIRHSGKYNKRKVNSILNAVKKKKYRIIKKMKIESSVKNKKLIALNDINIHYKPPHAIRLQVKLNNKIIVKELIGDGVLISTPYGSSGYFSSITRKTFKNGIGIAFNNPVKIIKPKIVNKNSKIEVKVLRGEGFVAVDCIEKLIPIKKGDIIKIRKHARAAKFIKLKNKKVKLKV